MLGPAQTLASRFDTNVSGIISQILSAFDGRHGLWPTDEVLRMVLTTTRSWDSLVRTFQLGNPIPLILLVVPIFCRRMSRRRRHWLFSGNTWRFIFSLAYLQTCACVFFISNYTVFSSCCF